MKLHCSVLVIHCTELRDIPVNFSVSLRLLLDPGCLPDCISVQLYARYSVPFWRSSAVRYRLSKRSSSLCLTELTAHFLLENSLQIRFASHPFSWQSNLIENLSSFTKWHVYQLWRNNDVTLITLHCVSCRVGSLHLLGSSYGILENVGTNFTHISQKWFYFSVHYTF